MWCSVHFWENYHKVSARIFIVDAFMLVKAGVNSEESVLRAPNLTDNVVGENIELTESCVILDA